MRVSLLDHVSIWSVPLKNDSRYAWRKLLKVRPVLKPHVIHVIGNGQQSFLWNDPWHPHGVVGFYSQRGIYDAALGLNSVVAAVIKGDQWVWPPTKSDSLVQIETVLCGTIPPYSALEEKLFLQPRVIWFNPNFLKFSFIAWLTNLEQVKNL